MNEVVRIGPVLACVVGLTACSFSRPPELADPDDASVADAQADAPGDALSGDGSGSDGPVADASPPPMFLSCAQVPTNCGPSGTDSCCNSPAVPGGTYARGYDLAGDSNSNDASYPATISSFRLDKYRVTVSRFRIFVNSGLGTQEHPPIANTGAHAKIAESGWQDSWNVSLAANTTALISSVKCNASLQTWTDAPENNERLPINCITWYEAMAFCIWDGGYLPTEAEWNYAAAGGSEQRAYPWSVPASSLAIDRSHASYYDGTGCIGDGNESCTRADIAQVGARPAGDGRWGHSDMAGTVFDWTIDWYATSYANPCVDCANLTPASGHVIRGSTYSSGAELVRTNFRGQSDSSFRYVGTGIRCARAP